MECLGYNGNFFCMLPDPNAITFSNTGSINTVNNNDPEQAAASECYAWWDGRGDYCDGQACSQDEDCKNTECRGGFCTDLIPICTADWFSETDRCEGMRCERDDQCWSGACVGWACGTDNSCMNW